MKLLVMNKEESNNGLRQCRIQCVNTESSAKGSIPIHQVQNPKTIK